MKAFIGRFIAAACAPIVLAVAYFVWKKDVIEKSEDTKRLDFLNDQLGWGDCFGVQPIDSGQCYVRPFLRRYAKEYARSGVSELYPDIRSAIDATMKARNK